MADRIIGYPSNLTTVSAGPTGNVRVTYQPWELDWEWFDLMAVDGTCWLANTTTAVSAAINAKGGAEHTGYWFEIGVAFPNANWNTADRIAPQRQAAINQHATFAAAIAAMAVNDYFLVWYNNTSNLRFWGFSVVPVPFASIGGSLWGMLSRCQIEIYSNLTCVLYSGNLLAQNQQARIVNLNIMCQRNAPAVRYNPTAGQAGAGISGERCLLSGAPGFLISLAVAGSCRLVDCELYLCQSGANLIAGTTSLVTRCTAMWNVGSGMQLNNNVSTNLVAHECTVCFVAALGTTFSADSDGTLPNVATNLRNLDPRTQIMSFYDLASPGQKKFPCDGRLQRESVCRAAGVAVAGVTVDKDGQLLPNPPSMGAYEPYEVCYAPAAEIVRGAAKRGVIA